MRVTFLSIYCYNLLLSSYHVSWLFCLFFYPDRHSHLHGVTLSLLFSWSFLFRVIMADQQVEILQKLEKMGNLESVVTEQKIRIEKLRTTYETLKAEHLQLQDVSYKITFPVPLVDTWNSFWYYIVTGFAVYYMTCTCSKYHLYITYCALQYKHYMWIKPLTTIYWKHNVTIYYIMQNKNKQNKVIYPNKS